MGDSMPFIPAWFDDLDLTAQEMRVLIRVARRRQCFESHRSIAESCQLSRNTVSRAIKSMLEKGVIQGSRDQSNRPFLELVARDLGGSRLSRNGSEMSHTQECLSGSNMSRGGSNMSRGGSNGSQNGSNGGPEGTTPLKLHSEGTSFKREALPKKATSKKRFEKPAVEQVSAYMISRGFDTGKASDQADAFVDHFEANGWRIGGRAPMRDWRAAVRTWIRNADRWTMSAKPDANKLPRDPALDEDKNPNWWAACL